MRWHARLFDFCTKYCFFSLKADKTKPLQKEALFINHLSEKTRSNRELTLQQSELRLLPHLYVHYQQQPKGSRHCDG